MTDTNDTNDTKTRWWTPRRIAILVAAIAVAIVMSWGEVTNAGNRLEEAKQTCVEAADAARAAANQYDDLYTGEAMTASALGTDDVTDSSVITKLANAMDAEEPATVSCNAHMASEYKEQTKQLESNTTWYNEHYEALKQAVDAVNAAAK